MSDYVVGLTGGIGSGKSTAAELFVAAGAELVDTDMIAHELTGPQGQAMPLLIDAFGSAIATPDGALDRKAMRSLAFADPAARKRLESILHPLIRQISSERCRLAAKPYVILAVPLLVEAGNYRQRCDRIAVVDCPESRQIARVMARSGLSEAEALAIMATQAKRSQRLAVADDVLDNDGDLKSLAHQVGELHQKYLGLSAEKPKANC